MNAADVANLLAERDRLRAVVDEVVNLRREEERGREEDVWASWHRLTALLDQLDGSADMGGSEDHAEETCVDTTCPLHGSFPFQSWDAAAGEKP